MAFKLSKQDMADIAEATGTLQDARSAVETAVDAFNSAIDDAGRVLTEAVEKHNEAAEEIRSKIADIASQMQSDFDDKPEKWQEGDRGTATKEWIEAIEECGNNIEDIDFQEPEQIDLDSLLPDAEQVDLFDNLPTEPEF